MKSENRGRGFLPIFLYTFVSQAQSLCCSWTTSYLTDEDTEMSEGDEANGDLRRHDLILSVRDGPSGSTNMAPETGQVYRLSAIPLVPTDGVKQGGVERLSSRLGPRMIFQP